MATLEIGYTSSHCAECRKAGVYAAASPNEAGHFTCVGGYSPVLNGLPGCKQKWDKVVVVYAIDFPREDALRLWKERWPHLAGVRDEDWTVLSTWDVGATT